MNLLQSH